ncbi:MAG: HAD family hydrolase [Nanoarchaeota archaeon]
MEGTKVNNASLYFDVWDTIIYPPNSVECSRILEGIVEKSPYAKGSFFGEWKNYWFKKEKTRQEFIGHIVNVLPLLQESRNDIERAIDLYFKDVKVYPEVVDTLGELRARGYKLGIISDTGRDTKDKLEELGLIHCFDDVHFSYSYGCVKEDGLYDKAICVTPNKRIFMIGNDPVRDYSIPAAKGIICILVDRNNRYPQITGRVLNLREVISKIEDELHEQ